MFLQRIGLAAHHQTRVTWEEAIVTKNLIVLETLYAEQTTVKEIFRRRDLIGAAVPTVVQVYDFSNLFM